MQAKNIITFGSLFLENLLVSRLGGSSKFPDDSHKIKNLSHTQTTPCLES